MRKHATAAIFLAVAMTVSTATAASAGKGGKKGGGNPPPPPPSADVVVSLGDSYISGEAGRWFGNSSNNSGSRNGTDRAWVSSGGGYYDTSLVYLQGTDNDGCHRSDVADVHHSGGVSTINLACSGAVANNVWRASQGGVSQNGWAPQADQLAAVAAGTDIDVIVLSIGGNDLGFSDIIIQCTSDWMTSTWWNTKTCNGQGQQDVNNAMPGAMADVAKAIDEVNAVMAAAGDTDYRFVLRSYASPIPRGSENRYPETGWSRLNDGGCPFWNVDSDWARDSLVPQISSNLASVAATKGVEFLDVQDLLEDREVCSTSTSHVGTGGPNGASHEWARWLNTGWNQGDMQESMHPNAYGQEAAGNCLEAMLGQPVGSYDCVNVSGQGPATISLSAS